MSLKEILSARRTIHHFDSTRTFSQDILLTAIELGLWAPNHRLTFPWRYSLIGPQKRQELLKVHLRLAEKKQPGIAPEELARVQEKFLAAPYLVMLSQKLPAEKNQMLKNEDYATCSMAVQNISIFLWEQGIGSKWSTSGMIRDPETYQILNMAMDEEELIGLLWVGFAKKIPPASMRPPLDQVLRILE
jgi:nitroreductase